MALTVNGIVVALGASELPSGYSQSAVTTFDDHEYTSSFTYTVTKASVENATPATTVNNLVAALVTQLTTSLADFDATNNVEAYGRLLSVTANFDPGTKQTSDFWNNTAISFTCVVQAFTKSS